MNTNKLIISIITTAFNEEALLPSFIDQVRSTMEALEYDFEIVITDNGSIDGTLKILKEACEADSRVKYISLTRNFGHQGGLIAALEYCSGDAIISMDADLQHPPEKIPDLIQKWEEGFEVVFTVKTGSTESFARRMTNHLFYKTLSRISGLEMTSGQSDFRLMDRKALDQLLSLSETNKFLRGLSRWIGYKSTNVEYIAQERLSGKTKFKLINLYNFAIDGVFSFSTFPVHLIMLFGLVISAASLLYATLIVVTWVYSMIFNVGSNLLPSGWTSIAIGIFFLGGVQLVSIGVLGEYIARAFEETKRRPSFIVREASQSLDKTSGE